MFNRNFIKACSLFSLIALTGCATSYNTTYFDLDRSSLKESPNLGVAVPEKFGSTIPASTKMIFYFDKCQVKYDIYNNWSQNPQDIITRYFILYLNNPDKQLEETAVNKSTMSGTIYRFECDTTQMKAVFVLGISFTDSKGNTALSKIYSSEANLEKLSASAFAEAMSKAVAQTAGQIYIDIKNTAQHNRSQNESFTVDIKGNPKSESQNPKQFQH